MEFLAEYLREDPSFSTGNTDDFQEENGQTTDNLDMFDGNLAPPVIAICTDLSRCGSAIYYDSKIQLLADRIDHGEPYKGLDIIIQRILPDKVIISSVQKRLIEYLEKRFQFDKVDISKKYAKTHQTNTPISHIAATAKSQHQERHSSQDTIIFDSTSTNSQNLPTLDSGQILEQNLIDCRDISDKAFTLVIVPHNWFSMTRALQRLTSSEMVENKGLTDSEQKFMFITSKVDKSVDACAVRSIAALDAYFAFDGTDLKNNDQLGIDHRGTQGSTNRVSQAFASRVPQSQPSQIISEPNPLPNFMPILDVMYIDPGPVLSIDRSSLRSLGIIGSSRNNSDKGKNDQDDVAPTLYEFLNQCSSIQGKRYLRTIMMWPLQDEIEIEHRHKAIEYFMDMDNKNIVDQLKAQLKNVIPLSALLSKLNHSLASYRELTSLYKTVWSIIAVLDLTRTIPSTEIEVINRIISLDSEEFRQVVASTLSLIDFDASKMEKRVQVTFGVNQAVDEKKDLLKNLTKFCNEVALEETAKYKDKVGKIFTVSYIPRIGFLDSIEYSSTSELMEIRANHEFNVLLHSDRSIYFKTRRMEDLDKNAGDIFCDLIDIQETVVLEVQNSMLKFADTILKLTDLCGEMDCLISFATVSQQKRFVKPQFVAQDEEIDLRQAYNPLQSITHNVIPNDIHFYKDSSGRKAKVMIITGPNSCGKTTLMKTTCLIIYMAHIGCFVPATQARIPIVDAILTRMNSTDSISTGLSSFATDVQQMNYALSRATVKSIIAIDEFGKGTQANDGFHLLKALVVYFARGGQDSPYVMVASHFTRLIDHLQSHSEYILYKTFKITRNLSKDSITYEYCLIDGVGETALSDEVALRAGVPKGIIERARQIREYITDGRAIRARPPSGA